MLILGIIGGVAAIAVICMVLLINKLTVICEPNEVLILSGAQRAVGVKTVGYRTITGGGRTLRIPLLEQVDKMDLTNMVINLKVRGAFSKGGIPLNVEGVANVAVSAEQPALTNAIERFLGKNRNQVMSTAGETLEGNLRGVLATLTPEEVNNDREKFGESLTQEADVDLQTLGLKLLSLKIQHVSDDVGYLDSIGRKQTAELLMRSRIAEAENHALAAERSADNFENQEIAKVAAQIETAKADARKRIVDAQSKKLAMVAEQRGGVAAMVARAKAEVGVQQARMEQIRHKLQADRIRPAEAKRAQMIEQARGHSAKITEQGKATAAALKQVAATWKSSGENARQVFVAQKLAPLVRQLMSTVVELPIDKVTFIDNALNTSGDNVATKATVVSEQLKHMVGVDLPALARKFGATPERANGANGASNLPPTPQK